MQRRLCTVDWLVPAAVALAGSLASAAEPPNVTRRPGADRIAEIQRTVRDSEYHVVWRDQTALSGLPAAWQAPNRVHDLRFHFTDEGVRVADRTAPASVELLRLGVVGVGRQGAVKATDRNDVAVATDGGRIERRSAGWAESFVNHRGGLQHRFEIENRPEGDGPLVITLSWRAAGLRLAGTTAEFTALSGRRLVYSVRAEDATGAAIPLSLRSSAGSTLEIVLEDRGAAYPIGTENLLTATPNTLLEGNDAGGLGEAVAPGDVNGDGYADVVTVALGLPGGPPYTTGVLVYHGRPGGIPSNGSGSAIGAADAVIEFPYAEYSVSVQVVAADLDVNGDGFQDLIVGSPDWDAITPPPATPQERGAVWVFHGSASGITASSHLDADAFITCDVVGGQFGFRTRAAGDVNGDGYGDLAVVALGWSDDPGQPGERAVFVFQGSSLGITATTTADAETTLEGNLGGLVFDVVGAEDLDGDGFDDLAIGLEGYSEPELAEGAVAVFYGRAGGIPSNPTQPMDDAADVLLEGNEVGLQFGLGVGGGGDVNGDGFADLLVGGYPWNNSEGALFVFHGGPGGIPSNGAVSAFDAADTAIEGNPPLGNGIALGWEVLGAGDVNGDGFADVVATAPFFENGERSEGAAFVFYGRPGGIPDSRALPVEQVADIVIESNIADLCLAGWGNKAAYGDVNGDGFADFIVGAPLYSNPGLYEGSVWIFHGAAQGLGPDAAWEVSGGQGDAWFGSSVASAGDVNGDGYSDLAVGAPFFDAGVGNEGRAFVFYGGPNGLPAFPDWVVDGSQPGEQFGSALGSAGDVNGDGFGDLIVGAKLYSNGEPAEGRVDVFLGSDPGLAAIPHWSYESDSSGAYLGTAVAGAGDVNGDGFGDVLVGAESYTNGQNAEGRSYLFYGSSEGIVDGPAWTFESDHSGAALGKSLASAGDVNGDGFADVLVGGPWYSSGEDSEGKAWAFYGSPAGLDAVPQWMIEPNRVGASYGWSLAGVGDVNGDGFDDVAVGADGDSNPEPAEGRTYVYHGSAAGLSTTADQVLEMNRAGAQFGSSVAGAGDVNGDGFGDVVVGAFIDSSPEPGEGRAYLFLGSGGGVAPAPVWIGEGGQDVAYFGLSVAGTGDVDGDGFADVAIGAPIYDGAVADEGAVFLYAGNARLGRPVLARQLRGGDDPAPVQPWGLSHSGDAFKVRMRATSPRGRELAKLHAEACPPGMPFGSPACHHAVSGEWTEVPPIPEGVELTESVTGLAQGVLYHWRAHVLYAPLHAVDPGITPPLNPRHGPWRRLFARASAADVRVDPEQVVTAAFLEPLSVVPEGGLFAEAVVVVYTSNGAATGAPASVQWATVDGSAVGPEDYVPASGAIELPSGTPSGHLVPVVVELLDDSVDEPDEDFRIELSGPSGMVIEQGIHEVVIVDDDPPPDLAGANTVVPEGAGAAHVELVLSAPSAFQVEVHYATQDGAAVAGDDYLPASGVAVIPPMAPATEVVIQILDDGESEPEEHLYLELWDPVNAVLLTPVVTVTIVDDDLSGLPFEDGFESGDTSAWSATVP